MIRNSWGNAAKKTVRCGRCGYEAVHVKAAWRTFRAHEPDWGGTGPMSWACPQCHTWNRYPHGLPASPQDALPTPPTVGEPDD